MIDKSDRLLGVRQQCKLLQINRSRVYYKPVFDNDAIIANLIYEIWLQKPFYGYRKITEALKRNDYKINHKRVLRIMSKMNVKALYPKKRTTISNIKHKKYPYLLNDIVISYPNQVWATDITYIKILGGFIYLVALIDWHSRFIVKWEISISLDSEFCLSMLHKALDDAKPEILNTDQGVQFTSNAWIEIVEKNEIKVSMDGKGRWVDNVIIERFWRTIKHEHVLLHAYNSVNDAKKSIGEFIKLYNYERLHQSLKYKTPAEVYFEKN